MSLPIKNTKFIPSSNPLKKASPDQLSGQERISRTDSPRLSPVKVKDVISPFNPSSELEALKKENEALKRQLGENDNLPLQRRVEELININRDQQKEIDGLRSKVFSNDSSAPIRLSTEIDSWRQKYRDLEDKLSILAIENEHLRSTPVVLPPPPPTSNIFDKLAPPTSNIFDKLVLELKETHIKLRDSEDNTKKLIFLNKELESELIKASSKLPNNFLLADELDKNNRLIKELNVEKEDLKRKIGVLISDNEALVLKIKEILGLNDKHKGDVSHLLMDNELNVNKIKELQAETAKIPLLVNEIALLQQKKEGLPFEYQEKLISLANENSLLFRELGEYRGKVSLLNNENISLKEKVPSYLENELKTQLLREEKETLKKNIQVSKQELDALKDKVAQYSPLRAHSSNKIGSLEQELEDKTNIIKGLISEMNVLQAKNAKISDLINENNLLHKNLEESSENIGKLVNELISLKNMTTDLAAKNKEFEPLREKLTHLEGQNQEYRSKLLLGSPASKEKTINELKFENDSLKNSLQGSNLKINALASEIAELNSVVKNLSEKNKDVIALKSRITTLENENNSLKDSNFKINALTSEITELNSVVKNLSEKNKDMVALKSRITTLETENTQYQLKLKEFSPSKNKKEREMDDLIQENQLLNKSLGDSSSKIKALVEELNSLQTFSKDLSTENSLLKSKLNDSNQKIKNLVEELQALQAIIRDLNKKNNEVEIGKGRLDNCEERVRELIRENSVLQARLSESTNRIGELEGELSKVKDQYDEIKNKLDKTKKNAGHHYNPTYDNDVDDKLKSLTDELNATQKLNKDLASKNQELASQLRMGQSINILEPISQNKTANISDLINELNLSNNKNKELSSKIFSLETQLRTPNYHSPTKLPSAALINNDSANKIGALVEELTAVQRLNKALASKNNDLSTQLKSPIKFFDSINLNDENKNYDVQKEIDRLKAENTELRQRSSPSRNRIDEFNDYSDLKIKLKESGDKISELIKELNDVHQKNSDLFSKVNQLEGQLKQSDFVPNANSINDSQKIKDLIQELGRVQKLNSDLFSKVNQLESQLKQSDFVPNASTSNDHQQIKDLLQELGSVQRLNRELSSKVNQLEGQLKQSDFVPNANTSNDHQQIKDLIQELGSVQKLNRELANQNSELNSQLKGYDFSNNNQLNNTNYNSPSKTDDSNESAMLRNKLAVSGEKITSLIKELNQLQNRNSELSTQLHRLESQLINSPDSARKINDLLEELGSIQNLNKELSQKNIQLKSLLNNGNQLTLNLNDLVKENSELQNKINANSIKIASLIKESNELNAKNSDLSAKIVELQKNNIPTTNSNNFDKIQALLDELNAVQTLNKRLSNENQLLKANSNGENISPVKVFESSVNSNDRISELVKELNNIQNLNKDLQLKRMNLENILKSQEINVNEEKQSLALKLEETLANNRSLNSKISEISNENQKLNHQLNGAVNQIELLIKKLNDLTEQFALKQKEVENLRNVKLNSPVIRESVQYLINNNSAKKNNDNTDSLINELKELREKNNKLIMENLNMQVLLGEAQSKPTSDNNKEEQMKINDLNIVMENRNLKRMHERQIAPARKDNFQINSTLYGQFPEENKLQYTPTRKEKEKNALHQQTDQPADPSSASLLLEKEGETRKAELWKAYGEDKELKLRELEEKIRVFQSQNSEGLAFAGPKSELEKDIKIISLTERTQLLEKQIQKLKNSLEIKNPCSVVGEPVWKGDESNKIEPEQKIVILMNEIREYKTIQLTNQEKILNLESILSLNDSSQQIKGLISQKNELYEKIVEKELKISSLSEKTRFLEDQVQKLKSSLENKSNDPSYVNEKPVLRGEIQTKVELEQRIAILTNEIREYKTVHLTNEEKILNLESLLSLNDSSLKIKGLLSQKNELYEQIVELSRENHALNHKLELLGLKDRQFDSEIAFLNEKIRNQDEMLKKRSQMNQDEHFYQLRNAQLEAEIQILRENQKKLDVLIRNMSSDNEKESLYQKGQMRNNQLEMEVKSLREKNDAFEREMGGRMKIVREYEEKLAMLSTEIERLNNQMPFSSESQAQKIKIFETSSLSSLENEDLRETIKLLLKELENNNVMLERKSQEIKELRAKYGELASKSNEKEYLLKIEILEIELSNFRSLFSKSDQTILSQTQQISDLQSQLAFSASDQRLSLLTDELVKVTTALKEAWSEKEEEAAGKRRMEEEVRRMIEQVKGNKELILELENVNKELSAKSRGHLPQTINNKQNEENIAELIENIRELELKEEHHQEDKQLLHINNSLLQKEIENLKSESLSNTALKKQIEDLQPHEPKVTSSSLLEFISRIDHLESLATQKIGENEQIRARNEILLIENARVNDMEGKLSFLSAEIYNLTDMLQKKIEENINLQENLRETQLKLTQVQLKFDSLGKFEEGCEKLLDSNETLRKDLMSSAEKLRKKRNKDEDYEKEILHLISRTDELTQLLTQKKVENEFLLIKMGELESLAQLSQLYHTKMNEMGEEVASLRAWRLTRQEEETAEKERKLNNRNELFLIIEEVRKIEEESKRTNEEKLALLEELRALKLEGSASTIVASLNNELTEKVVVLLGELERINEVLRMKEEEGAFMRGKSLEIEQKSGQYELMEVSLAELEGQVNGYKANMAAWEIEIREKTNIIFNLKESQSQTEFKLAAQLVESQSLRQHLVALTEENQSLQNQVFDLSYKIQESEGANEKEIGDFVDSFESLKKTYQETSNSLTNKIEHYEGTVHKILEELERTKKRAEENERRRAEIEEQYNLEKVRYTSDIFSLKDRLAKLSIDYLSSQNLLISLNSQLEVLQSQHQEITSHNAIMKEKLAITEALVRELEVYRGAWEKERVEEEQRGRRWEEEERRLRTKIEENEDAFYDEKQLHALHLAEFRSEITMLHHDKESLIEKVEALLIQLSKLQTKLGESEGERVNLQESLLKLSNDNIMGLQETMLKYRLYDPSSPADLSSQLDLLLTNLETLSETKYKNEAQIEILFSENENLRRTFEIQREQLKNQSIGGWWEDGRRVERIFELERENSDLKSINEGLRGEYENISGRFEDLKEKFLRIDQIYISNTEKLKEKFQIIIKNYMEEERNRLDKEERDEEEEEGGHKKKLSQLLQSATEANVLLTEAKLKGFQGESFEFVLVHESLTTPSILRSPIKENLEKLQSNYSSTIQSTIQLQLESQLRAFAQEKADLLAKNKELETSLNQMSVFYSEEVANMKGKIETNIIQNVESRVQEVYAKMRAEGLSHEKILQEKDKQIILLKELLSKSGHSLTPPPSGYMELKQLELESLFSEREAEKMAYEASIENLKNRIRTLEGGLENKIQELNKIKGTLSEKMKQNEILRREVKKSGNWDSEIDRGIIKRELMEAKEKLVKSDGEINLRERQIKGLKELVENQKGQIEKLYELIEQRKTEYEKLSSELSRLKEASVFQHPDENTFKEELQLMAIEIEETAKSRDIYKAEAEKNSRDFVLLNKRFLEIIEEHEKIKFAHAQALEKNYSDSGF